MLLAVLSFGDHFPKAEPFEAAFELTSVISLDDSPNEALLGQVKTVVADSDHIFVLNHAMKKPIKVYSRSGSFIQNLGMKGEGPEEYLDPTDIALKGNALHVLDNRGRVLLQYDEEMKFVQKLDIYTISKKTARTAIEMSFSAAGELVLEQVYDPKNRYEYVFIQESGKALTFLKPQGFDKQIDVMGGGIIVDPHYVYFADPYDAYLYRFNRSTGSQERFSIAKPYWNVFRVEIIEKMLKENDSQDMAFFEKLFTDYMNIQRIHNLKDHIAIDYATHIVLFEKESGQFKAYKYPESADGFSKGVIDGNLVFISEKGSTNGNPQLMLYSLKP